MNNLPGKRGGVGWRPGRVSQEDCEKPGALPGSAASGAVSLADSKELDYIQLTVL